MANLGHHRALYPYLHGSKVLDNIYFEMICRDRPKHCRLRPNGDTITDLINLIETYPPDTIFLFYFTTKGYEDVFLRLHAHFGIKVHVDEDTYQLFQKISDPAIYDYGPLFTIPNSNDMSGNFCYYDEDKACLTTDLTRFRSCKPDCACLTREIPGVVHAKVCVANDLQWVAQRNQPQEISSSLNVPITEGKDAKGNPVKVYKLPRDKRPFPDANSNIYDEQINEQYITNTDKTQLLPCHIKYNFSRHSSFEEIFNLIKLFGPRQVYPFDHGVSGARKFRMRKLFGEVCSGTEFRFDQEREKYELNFALQQEAREKKAIKGDDETDIGTSTSLASKSIDGVADYLWNGTGSAESLHSISTSIATALLKEDRPNASLPLYGNPMLKKGLKRGWNCVNNDEDYPEKHFGVYMNTAENFTQQDLPGSFIGNNNNVNDKALTAAININEILQKENKKERAKAYFESSTSEYDGIADQIFGQHRDSTENITGIDLHDTDETQRDNQSIFTDDPKKTCTENPVILSRMELSQLNHPQPQSSNTKPELALRDIKLESHLFDFKNEMPLVSGIIIEPRLSREKNKLTSFPQGPGVNQSIKSVQEALFSPIIVPEFSRCPLSQNVLSSNSTSSTCEDIGNESRISAMDSLFPGLATKKPALKRLDGKQQIRISMLNGRSIMKYAEIAKNN